MLGSTANAKGRSPMSQTDHYGRRVRAWGPIRLIMGKAAQPLHLTRFVGLSESTGLEHTR